MVAQPKEEPDIAEHSDTNMRALTMVASLEKLGVLFEIGAVPGKARTTTRRTLQTGEVHIRRVDTTAQSLKPVKDPDQPQPVSDRVLG